MFAQCICHVFDVFYQMMYSFELDVGRWRDDSLLFKPHPFHACSNQSHAFQDPGKSHGLILSCFPLGPDFWWATSGGSLPKTTRRQRDRIALFNEKEGFSVVAPINTMVPRSQSKRRASWDKRRPQFWFSWSKRWGIQCKSQLKQVVSNHWFSLAL